MLQLCLLYNALKQPQYIVQLEDEITQVTQIQIASFNQAIFCNTSNQGGLQPPSLDFRNRAPNKLGFGI